MPNKKIILLYISIIMSLLIFSSGQLSAAGGKIIILIDPAHGGEDQGVKLNNNVFEKDITLTIALSMKKALARENKLELYLTRESDKTVDLEDRKDIIKKIKPDIVLSLHVNGGLGKEASGFEIYYPEFAAYAGKEKKAAKENTVQLKNKCQSNSLKMAKIIQENMNALFPRKGRGLRKADMPITDDLLVSAISVEMGFATNPQDNKKLLAVNTQTEIAKALANSIKSFYR